ncbi:MAG TPA: uroporphyrinogen-III C-methyltransferase [Solirubrobacteraceae bacterium]|jgi:uroporphyrinogen III methyltransferase/synthase|nr:uroporphyrinogen-III C-methyltransferase [Solirubrobacteraceae bacterium]
MSAADGRVALVGAGPGDAGLLTARAVELIALADVILYDRLIPPEALAGARPDAELRYVGKEGGGPFVPQEETEALMLERARSGAFVVRLKGGDPFVFGRGGEEALALAAAGIPFEVVPGVTAGIAAAAYTGIPVTHRGLASGVALIAAHEDPAKDEQLLDWDALARFPGTLVFYMGVRTLPVLTKRLLEAGRPGSQPAAVVSHATLPGQRTVAGTLATIAADAQAAEITAPAITVIGDVARMHSDLAWRSPGPLEGASVVVTRARAQASELAARLRALGAAVIETPSIRIVQRSDELPSLVGFDLVCLTSPNGVAVLFEKLAARGEDARALAGARVAVIGPGTARALREHGVIADVVAERFVAEGLIESLSGLEVSRALIARAGEARDVLPDALRERGAEVVVASLYDTRAEPIGPALLGAVEAASYVTFTSSSTVRYFLQSTGVGPATRVVSIGPVTSETLREQGIDVHVEAERHDIDGLVAALVRDHAERR